MRNDVEKEAKSNVDIMKFILSIMVVCIHTGVTSLMPAEIGKLVNSIFNLAVPIFFVYSGYFFSCEDNKYTWKMVGQYKNAYIITVRDSFN